MVFKICNNTIMNNEKGNKMDYSTLSLLGLEKVSDTQKFGQTLYHVASTSYISGDIDSKKANQINTLIEQAGELFDTFTQLTGFEV